MTVKTVLKHSFRIAWKDLLELFRNRLGLALLVIMPLFMMVMVGFIYPSNAGTPTDLPIALVNQDAGYNGSTVPSQTFITVLQGINNQTGMMVLTNVTSQSTVKEMIQRSELSGAIVIPSNFSECLLNGEQGTISIITDDSNPQMSAVVRGALTGVINQMGIIMAQQTTLYMHPTINSTQALAMVQPIVVSAPSQTGTQTTSSLSIGLVNADVGFANSTLPSQTFATMLQGISHQTDMMSLTVVSNESVAQSMIKAGTLDGAVVLPSDFSQSILTGHQGTVKILADESDPIGSATVVTALTAVINQMGTLIAQQTLQATLPTLNSTQALAMVQPYVVSAPTISTSQSSLSSNLPIVVVNLDLGYNGSTAASEGLVTMLGGVSNQTGTIKLIAATSESAANDMIRSGSAVGAVVISSDFSKCLSTGQQGNVKILVDGSNPVMATTVGGMLTSMVNGMGTIMAQQTMLLMHPAINDTQALAIVQPYVVPAPPQSNYFDFIAPGIMAMTVMMSVMTGLPVAISQEKEIGTMDGMMVAPVNRLSILLGKTIAQTARGLIQGVVILVLAVGLFGVTIQGNILLVFALLLLGVFSFVGLGIVITSFTKDQETAQMLMMTLMFPMMFLSGVFFPVQQMPWYMQDISKMLPLTYAADALRKVMVLGAGVPQISTELIVLIVFGVVMIAIALPVFRRMMTR